MGTISLKQNRAKSLGIKKYQRLSPLLEKCSLLVCANSSYLRAEEDLTILMGIKLGHSSLHRQVNRKNLPESISNKAVETLSVDGGKIKLRNETGTQGEWRDYKAVSLDNGLCEAYFQENEKLQQWVNRQRLFPVVNCLGDGHDGIWNLISEIMEEEKRREILDWYHLVENVEKVKVSKKKKEEWKKKLWEGQGDEVGEELLGHKNKKVKKLGRYVKKHRERIVEYDLYQELGIEIGSGSVESKVKQIGNRVKIAGAQWKRENVAQILRLRCAYLNGMFTPSIYA